MTCYSNCHDFLAHRSLYFRPGSYCQAFNWITWGYFIQGSIQFPWEDLTEKLKTNAIRINISENDGGIDVLNKNPRGPLSVMNVNGGIPQGLRFRAQWSVLSSGINRNTSLTFPCVIGIQFCFFAKLNRRVLYSADELAKLPRDLSSRGIYFQCVYYERAHFIGKSFDGIRKVWCKFGMVIEGKGKSFGSRDNERGWMFWWWNILALRRKLSYI